MTSRGKRNFPFKRESKPVVNETLKFDEPESRRGSSERAQSGPSNTRGTASKIDPKTSRASLSREAAATSGRPAESAARKSSGSSKTSSLAGRKRAAAEASDSGEDTEEQIDVDAAASKEKRVKLNPAPVRDSKKSAHYPSSDYVVEFRESDAGKKHKTLLVESVTSICSAEIAALEAYFASELPGSTHGSILGHLRDVLRELPGELQDECPTDATFRPEMARTERVKLTAEQNKIKAMNDALELLRVYSGNTEKFLSDSGLELPEAGAAGSRSAKKTSKASKKVENFAADFKDKLDQMDAMMDQILRAVDGASAVSRAARDSQQRLFDSHQKAKRYETFGGLDVLSGGSSEGGSSRSHRSIVGGDVDPKQLMKTMQSRY